MSDPAWDMAAVPGGLAGLPLPAVLVDADGAIRDSNAAAQAMLRLPQPAGGRLTDVLGEPRSILALLRDAGVRGTVTGREMTLAGAEDAVVLASASAVAGGMLVLLQDVAPLARRASELARECEAVERAMRGRMRFFAAASHDLRQPLQAISLFVGALESQVTGASARQVLDAIKSSLRTMEDMFDGLLDMSRLEAGVLQARPRAFMIGDVLEELEQEFAPQVKAGQVELRVMPSSQAVRSDPVLLTRILRNLLANAVRYTDTGRILVGCRHRGGMVRIEVWDTGRGIPEDQRAAIFDEFYRGPQCDGPGRGASGIGLGLSIVQGLARLLGHPLDVRSREGKGSMFAVEVPRAAVTAARAGPEADLPAPELSGCTVLVIDDDEDILEGLRLLLSQWGCRALVAAGGGEAVRTLQEQKARPDAVLADLRLRSGDGLAAVRRVVEELGQWVPTIVFTGSTERRGSIRVAGHALPVLRKPMDPRRLARVLAEVMRGR